MPSEETSVRTQHYNYLNTQHYLYLLDEGLNGSVGLNPMDSPDDVCQLDAAT